MRIHQWCSAALLTSSQLQSHADFQITTFCPILQVTRPLIVLLIPAADDVPKQFFQGYLETVNSRPLYFV